MALTVGVDTYVTATELEAYADARGVTITSDTSVLLTKAMDYLDTLEASWQGMRPDALQALAWPRYPVYIYGSLISDSAIPQQLKNAQCQLAIEADTQALMPTVAANASGSVTSEKVDVIEVSYADGAGNSSPIFKAVNAIIKPLYKTNVGGGSNFTVTRG